MNACKGLAGLIFGHKFQPRYSTGAPKVGELDVEDASPAFLLGFVEASKSKTYVHDVCVRCGAVAAGGGLCP